MGIVFVVGTARASLSWSSRNCEYTLGKTAITSPNKASTIPAALSRSFPRVGVESSADRSSGWPRLPMRWSLMILSPKERAAGFERLLHST
jgi:hypothetical protein